MRDYHYYCYQIIFKQEYNFIETARTLESVLQRVKEFIFLLIAKDTLLPILLIDSKDKELFNNVMHITLADIDKSVVEEITIRIPIYAKLRLRQHYAIPFTTTLEPFPLYRIAGDYATVTPNTNTNNNSSSSSTRSTEVILFALHTNQRQERVSIASYLRKHDLARTSIFYAYGEAMRQKLQSTHYHCTLLIASNSRITLDKALTAFKVQYFTHILKGNNNRSKDREKSRLLKELFKKPKKPLFGNKRYPVLSSIEVVSLMLPDSITGIRTTVDGIKPYTTGRIL